MQVHLFFFLFSIWGWGAKRAPWLLTPLRESRQDLIRTHLYAVSEIDDDLANDLWESDVMGLVCAKTASQKIAENAKKDALNHLSSREQNDSNSIVGIIGAKTVSKKLMSAKEKNLERNQMKCSSKSLKRDFQFHTYKVGL